MNELENRESSKETEMPVLFLIGIVEDKKFIGRQQEECRELKVEVVTYDHRRSNFSIPIDDFYNDNKLKSKIVRAAGPLIVNNKQIDFLRNLAIMHSNRTMHEIQVNTSVGWGEENSAFVTPSVNVEGGKIFYTRERQVELRNARKAINIDLKILPQQEIKRVADHIVFDLLNLQGPEIMYPLMGACYAAPLITPLGLQHKPIIWLHGPSGTGKTTIARLIQNFYGDFTQPSSLTSWDATSNQIERQGNFFKDCVFVVDDFKRATLGGDVKNAHRILHNYSDFTGRSRMTSRADLCIQGLLLVTGEDLPEEREALRARCLVLPIEQGYENFREHLDSCKQEADKYPGIMADYIAFLQKQEIEDIQRQRGELKSFYREKIDGRPNADRIAENYALIHLGFREYLSHMRSLGVISQDTLDGMDSEMGELLLSRMEAEAEDIEGTNSISRFPEIINEIIGSGNAHIRGWGTDHGSCIGVFRNGEVLLYPAKTYSVLDRYLKSCGKSGCELGQSSYAGALANKGFLKRGTKGHHTQQKRVAGRPVRVWVMDAEHLYRE